MTHTALSCVGTPGQWGEVLLVAVISCAGTLYLQIKEKKAAREPLVPSTIFAEPQKRTDLGPLISLPAIFLEIVVGRFSGVVSVFWPEDFLMVPCRDSDRTLRSMCRSQPSTKIGESF
jgi:hypothetical protein